MLPFARPLAAVALALPGCLVLGACHGGAPTEQAASGDNVEAPAEAALSTLPSATNAVPDPNATATDAAPAIEPTPAASRTVEDTAAEAARVAASAAGVAPAGAASQ